MVGGERLSEMITGDGCRPEMTTGDNHRSEVLTVSRELSETIGDCQRPESTSDAQSSEIYR